MFISGLGDLFLSASITRSAWPEDALVKCVDPLEFGDGRLMIIDAEIAVAVVVTTVAASFLDDQKGRRLTPSSVAAGILASSQRGK